MFRRNNSAAILAVATALVLAAAPAAHAAGSGGNSSASLKSLFATPSVTAKDGAKGKASTSGTSTGGASSNAGTRSHAAGRHGGGQSVSQLAHLQTEMAILKNEIGVLQLQLKRQKLRSEIAGGGGGVGMQSGQEYTPPKVSMVEGRVGHLTARLQFGNGSLLNVHTGSVLPDGSKVVLISADSVVIKRHGHRYPLAYVSDSQSGVPILYAPWSPPAIETAHRHSQPSGKASGGGR